MAAIDLPLMTTRTVRRAWLVLAAAFTLFAVLLTSAAAGGYVYHRSAMQAREGVLEASGEVLLQPRNETKFKQVRAGEPVREGDTIKTPSGVVARLVFFDGSQLQLAEGSQVVIEEIKSSRFVDEEKRLRLSQQQGWSRLIAAAAAPYKIGRFTMLLDGLEVETQSRAEGAEIGFELRPIAERPWEQAQATTREARAAVFRGSAQAWTGSERVTLTAGQATTLRPDGEITQPAALAHEYLRNGSFTDLALRSSWPDQERLPDLWPLGWEMTWHQGGDGGVLHGDARLEYQDIDGRRAPVIAFERRKNATDAAVVGIQQPLDLPLSHYKALRLQVVLKVDYHSLSGGGIESSEYPIIVKVTYRDRQNRSIAWIHGFYTHNEEKLRTKDGEAIPQNEWHTFTQDLLKLNKSKDDPEPVYLETLDIYAAGHDYEASIASVSIEGE
jgi:hypothetical protein